MPARYGPVHVPDPPEELPEFVSTRNESYATLKCLVWDRDALPEDDAPDGTSGRHFDILPAVIPRDTRPAALRMRKRRPPATAPRSVVSTANIFGGDAADSASPRERHHGVRSLRTTRALVGDPHYLEESGKELGIGRGSSNAKPETKMWAWQRRPCFDLRHEDSGVERSKLQIRQDAEREEDRKRRRAFNAHLRKVAMYRPANRIPLRHDSPERQLRQVAGIGGAAVPHPPAAVPRPPSGPPPSAALRHAASARRDADRAHEHEHDGSTPRGHRPILSARVRQKISAMADEFLPSRPSTARNTPRGAGSV